MVILVQNIESVTIGRAIIRGFSTALMHAVTYIPILLQQYRTYKSKETTD